MNDNFPYIYEGGHWLRCEDPEEVSTLSGIIETSLGFFAMAVCLVAAMMLWLCG